MIYVLISPQAVEQFNRGLMRLLRPSHLRDEHYVTDFYCQVLTHPSNGWAALVLNKEDEVPFHLEATGQELSDVLQQFVDDRALTTEERAGIVGAVVQNRGRKVRLANLIPPSWQQNVFTEEQMKEQGWFPDEVEL